ncbi:hypothetical protein D3C80_1733610 [compost metagenome]
MTPKDSAASTGQAIQQNSRMTVSNFIQCSLLVARRLPLVEAPGPRACDPGWAGFLEEGRGKENQQSSFPARGARRGGQ